MADQYRYSLRGELPLDEDHFLKIHLASPADARAVAEIHVAAWRTAFKGIIPADYLAGLSVDEREIFWFEAMARGTAELVVAREGAEVLGWVNFGACRDQDASPKAAEIWAIYVLPQHWSKGVGRLLWLHAQTRLAEGAFETVSLWVLAANARAIDFYLRAGFMPETSSGKEFFLGGELLREIRYVANLPPPVMFRNLSTQMQPSHSPTEQFLVNFHDARPGITSSAYGALEARRGEQTFRSSYECLIAEIEDADHAVLDLACGDGFLLSLLADRASTKMTLSGIDLSAGEIAAAHRRLNGAARLYCGRAQSLPMADNSVDHVVCHMALMLMDDLAAVLQEVQRVLVAGGKFSFTVGATPPSGQVALDAYVRRLMALGSGDNARLIRFGDSRLRDAAGIRQALAPWFTDISVQELALSRRYAPGELWAWFEGLYDLQFFTENEQARFKAGYLAEIEKLCDPDGKLEFIDTLRQVKAVVA